MSESNESIFKEFYREQPFIDRFLTDSGMAIDVIIPVIHTNELWKANLVSFYREIPIHHLIISDGGCIDDSLEIAKEFPRVKILNHRDFISLGYCIRKLIEEVDTAWFVYLHSDVYLPEKWFETMSSYQSKYDFYECNQRATMLIEHSFDYTNYNRALSGAQMGKVDAFKDVLPKIDDDFLYRNEDIVFSEMVKGSGRIYGRVADTFHYHQTLRKQSPFARKIKNVQIELEIGREEEVRTAMMQIKGIVKYLDPDPSQVPGILANLQILEKLGEIREIEFIQWVAETNPKWLPLLKKGLKKIGFCARIKIWLKKCREICNLSVE